MARKRWFVSSDRDKIIFGILNYLWISRSIPFKGVALPTFAGSSRHKQDRRLPISLFHPFRESSSRLLPYGVFLLKSPPIPARRVPDNGDPLKPLDRPSSYLVGLAVVDAPEFGSLLTVAEGLEVTGRRRSMALHQIWARHLYHLLIPCLERYRFLSWYRFIILEDRFLLSLNEMY